MVQLALEAVEVDTRTACAKLPLRTRTGSMTQFKYIVQKGDLGESIFLFPPWETHADIAARLGSKPISAGFVRILNDGKNLTVKTFGRSHSLDIDSRAQDADLIMQFIQTV